MSERRTTEEQQADAGTPPLTSSPVSSPVSSHTSSRVRGRWGWARLGRVALGSLLTVLGVLGLFLPFLQGVLFLAVGLTLLAPELPPVKRLLLAIYRRWPSVRRRIPRRYRRFRRDDRANGGANDG